MVSPGLFRSVFRLFWPDARPRSRVSLKYTFPITLAIGALLAVLVISYRQVISAFPGGGAYAVARTHLGTMPSLVAAASLVVDYVLNAAVGVSAGVEALVAAFPGLYPDRVVLCLVILAAITAANLWGAAGSARLFILPTVIFIVSFYVVQMITTVLLALAANTSFGGLPVLASLLATDNFLPHLFFLKADRQVHRYGIGVLAAAAAILLVVSGGDTQKPVPLFAIGVFVGFTLSQLGMVRHWHQQHDRGWVRRAAINGVGTVFTTVVLAIELFSKFWRARGLSSSWCRCWC